MRKRFDKLQFEPHAGYGKKDPDGEPWPFGYISTAPTPTPVFELTTIFKHPLADLRNLALAMAAAPGMREALLCARETLVQLRDSHLDHTAAVVRALVQKRIDQIDAALPPQDGHHG